MRSLSPRGASLAELLVALTLLGVLATAASALLGRTGDVMRAESFAIDREESLRAAAAILPAELRELNAADGDILAMSTTAITIRAPRQFGVLCRAAQPGDQAGEILLTLRASLRRGLRDFDPGSDSLWVYRDRGVADTTDPWVAASIVSLAADRCPDGAAGMRLRAARWAPPGTAPESGISAGAPVLGFEIVTYRLYRSSEDGRWYVGQQVGASLQPVLGPVTRDGLAFAYFDALGAVAADPTRVGLIEIRVRAPTPEPVRDAGGRLVSPVDSVVALVALRNNPRRPP